MVNKFGFGKILPHGIQQMEKKKSVVLANGVLRRLQLLATKTYLH